jgi:plasmid stabilization system protein ParE
MARQVVWSKRAQNDRKEILQFWTEKTQSTTYSKKLDSVFKAVVKTLKTFPHLGKPTNDFTARAKVVKDYLLIYEATDHEIIILTIWDTRQDPEKLKSVLQ